jgi:hypothetical protein
MILVVPTEPLLPLGFWRYQSSKRDTCTLLLLFISMGWNYVSELRPPTGLLFISQIIYKRGAPVEWYWQEKTGELEDKACPSVTLCTTNLRWTDPGANPWLRGERPATSNHMHLCLKEVKTVFLVHDKVQSCGSVKSFLLMAQPPNLGLSYHKQDSNPRP